MGSRDGNPHFAIVSERQAEVEKSTSFRAATTRFTLASWLFGSEELLISEAAAVAGRVRRRKWNTTPLVPPLRFSDVGAYVKHFSNLLSLLSSQTGADDTACVRGNVTIH